MHNHLYSLERQNLIQRLTPKRTINASFKCLFSFQAFTNELQFASETDNCIASIDGFTCIENLRQALKKDTTRLSKKQQILHQLKEEHNALHPLIADKITQIDSELSEKSLRLEVINELLAFHNDTKLPFQD